MPKGAFEGNSTYQNSYIPGGPEKISRAIKPQEELKVGGQFYGESNYSENYVNKGSLGKTEKYLPLQNQILPEGRFEENSTYASNYLRNYVERTPPMRK
jgi:hypothetical protein